MRRNRIQPAAGQVFAVPLVDASFGLGHVASSKGLTIVVALYTARERDLAKLASSIDGALDGSPIATLAVTSVALIEGEWPILANREPMYPELWLDKKGSSHTSQIVGSLLSAYHGLIAWDWLHDPRYYEKLLLPGVKVPPTIRYKKDIGSPLDAPRAAAPANDDPESVTGAAEIHVSIAYRGDGLPSVDLLRRRQALERRLEADGAGEVTDAGAGEGVMDLYLATQDARRALPLVRRAIAELGFGDDASIEVEDLG